MVGDWCYTDAQYNAQTIAIDGFDIQEKMIEQAKKATAELDNVHIATGWKCG